MIDVSLADASPLTRRSTPTTGWPAAAVQASVNRVMAATIATVRSNGTPHAAVVLTACLQGTVNLHGVQWLGAARNLERQPAISMTVTDRDHDLTSTVRRSAWGGRRPGGPGQGDLSGLSRRGYFLPSAWDGYLYRVRIDRIFLSA